MEIDGQCSAGTLPVAWIDEGPGPPRCPPPSYADVLTGGYERCTGRLAELVETDALAARITCEFTEVLIRYDCGQPYSLIHHCEDCKVKLKDNSAVFPLGLCTNRSFTKQNTAAHASMFWGELGRYREARWLPGRDEG
uniref:Uncharacterized protein n=1 Tax=Anopheles dirus TaxID=7168 RepID=A0A182N9E3_9DIPT